MSESPEGDEPRENSIEEELRAIEIRRSEIDTAYQRQNPWNHSVVRFRKQRERGIFPTLFPGSRFPGSLFLGSRFPREDDEEESPWSSMGRLRMQGVAERHTAEEIEEMNLWEEELRRQRDRMLDGLLRREAELRKQLAELRKRKGPGQA